MVRVKPMSLGAQLLAESVEADNRSRNNEDISKEENLASLTANGEELDYEVEDDHIMDDQQLRAKTSEWMRDYESYDESGEDDAGVYGTPGIINNLDIIN